MRLDGDGDLSYAEAAGSLSDTPQDKT